MSDSQILKLLPGGLKDQEDRKNALMAMILSSNTYVDNIEFVEEKGVQIGAVISLVLNIEIEEIDG